MASKAKAAAPVEQAGPASDKKRALETAMQQIEKMDLYQRKEYPQRSRNTPRDPRCLCENCSLDRAFCPRCTAYAGEQEAV